MIDDFQFLVGAPEIVHAQIDWATIEKRLGVVFPPDYREWADMYTGLEIDGFMWIRHPSDFYGRETPEGVAEELLGLSDIDIARDVRAEVFDEQGFSIGSKSPLPFYPDPHGLLPWGNTDNGDYLMWNTRGEPVDWKVTIADGDGYSWQEFNCGFLEFLVRLLRHEFASPILPEDFPRAPAVKEYQGDVQVADGLMAADFRPTARWESYYREEE